MPLKPEIAGGGLNEYQIIKRGRQQSWRRLIQALGQKKHRHGHRKYNQFNSE